MGVLISFCTTLVSAIADESEADDDDRTDKVLGLRITEGISLLLVSSNEWWWWWWWNWNGKRNVGLRVEEEKNRLQRVLFEDWRVTESAEDIDVAVVFSIFLYTTNKVCMLWFCAEEGGESGGEGWDDRMR